MAGKKSEEQVEKPSLESGVEHFSEIWHRAISKSGISKSGIVH